MVVPPEMRIRPVGNYGLWGDFGRGYTSGKVSFSIGMVGVDEALHERELGDFRRLIFYYLLERDETLSQVLEIYCLRTEISITDCNFSLRGRPVHIYDSPESLGLLHGDRIYVSCVDDSRKSSNPSTK